MAVTQKKLLNVPDASTQGQTVTAAQQQSYKPATSLTTTAKTVADATTANAAKTAKTAAAANPQAQLHSILAQVGAPDYHYNFNEDELFRYYADLYTQKGKQASLDTMGQAASLTGGYGNSYAQSVGNQQYQQYLLGLYDKGMDLQNAAYQRYNDDVNRKVQAAEYDRNMAYNYAMIMLNAGKMPTDDLLNAAGISKADALTYITPVYEDWGGDEGGSSGGSGGRPKKEPKKPLDPKILAAIQKGAHIGKMYATMAQGRTSSKNVTLEDLKQKQLTTKRG